MSARTLIIRLALISVGLLVVSFFLPNLFTGIIVTGIALFMIIYSVIFYNNVVPLQQDMDQKSNNLSAEENRKATLVIKLLDSVKAYDIFEKETLADIVKIRKEPQKFSSKELNFLFEDYPQLQSNNGYVKLMNSLEKSEDRIVSAKEKYNKTVYDYNTYVEAFPEFIFRLLFRYKKGVYVK